MKKLILLMFAAFALVSSANAQVQGGEDSDQVYQMVEQQAEFPGGTSKLMEFLSNNINYPAAAAKKKIQGRVIVSFIVETDGSLSNVTVPRSVDPDLDKEAIRVVKSMPKWNPGKQQGKPVRVKYMLPVTFRLN